MTKRTPKNVRIGLIQMAMVSSPEENRAKAATLIREAAGQGAEIICLPELFTGPYFCATEQNADAARYLEPIPGVTSSFLSELSASLGVILVGGSYYEQSGEHRFNTAVVFDEQGRSLGTYRKTHIPHDECFYEKNYFEPGDTGFKVFETSKGRIGVLICYDQWFPEAARAMALLGADIVFYPTAIGNADHLEEVEGNWQEAWENVQRGHAIANCMVVCGVNRVGREGEMTFWGGSFICDAFGTTLVRGGANEQVVIGTVDLNHSSWVREGWRFFYNRRPECYGILSTSEDLPHPGRAPSTAQGNTARGSTPKG